MKQKILTGGILGLVFVCFVLFGWKYRASALPEGNGRIVSSGENDAGAQQSEQAEAGKQNEQGELVSLDEAGNIVSEKLGERFVLVSGEEAGTEEDAGNSQTDSLSSANIPDSYLIEDFPVTLQMPELPTGCEITALTMTLNYYGYPADKTVMASEYLPTVSPDLYYGEDGRLYGPDMNEYFVGDPFTEDGIICGTGAIVTAADEYLSDMGSSLRAVDLTGSSVEELYARVSMDQPVVVWVTISMADRGEVDGWYTEDGEFVGWSHGDHGAVLVGYTDTTVTIADPISGEIEYDRAQFEEVFASWGNQCVVLE